MTFARLRAADWVAMLAALALLFVMAMDWYGTKLGDEARRVEGTAQPKGALGGEPARRVREDARTIAEGQEKNAWQESRAVDRLILLALLGTAGLAVSAGFLRAAGRRFEPPWTPSTLAALAAAASALLVLYRILQEPGSDDVTTLKAGAPLAVAVLGVLALACATALRSEEAGTAFREVTPDAPEGQSPDASDGQSPAA